MLGSVLPPTLLSNLKLLTRFVILIGPVNQFKHCELNRPILCFNSHVLPVFSKERLPFSVAYLSSLGLTLYFSLGVGTSCPI